MLQHLSAAQLALSRLKEAEQTAGEGLRLSEKYSDTFRQSALLATLALIHEAKGNPTEAGSLRRRAITIYEAENMPAAADKLRALLDAAPAAD